MQDGALEGALVQRASQINLPLSISKGTDPKGKICFRQRIAGISRIWEGVGLLGQIGAGKELKSSHEADELLTPPVAHKDLGCQGLQELCV